MWNGVIVACILSMNSAGEKVCDYSDYSKFVAEFTNKQGTGTGTKELCEEEINTFINVTLKPRYDKNAVIVGKCTQEVIITEEDIIKFSSKHIFPAAKK